MPVIHKALRSLYLLLLKHPTACIAEINTLRVFDTGGAGLGCMSVEVGLAKDAAEDGVDVDTGKGRGEEEGALLGGAGGAVGGVAGLDLSLGRVRDAQEGEDVGRGVRGRYCSR